MEKPKILTAFKIDCCSKNGSSFLKRGGLVADILKLDELLTALF
jgi:hypothetical protein